MQEEIEQKVVVEIKGCARLTGAELRRALAQLLIQLKNLKARSAQQGKGPHGKTTVRQLAAQDRMDAAQALLDEANDIHSTPEKTQRLRSDITAALADLDAQSEKVRSLAGAERDLRESTKRSRTIFKVMIGAAVLVVLLVLWLIFGSGCSRKPKTDDTAQPAPAATQPAQTEEGKVAEGEAEGEAEGDKAAEAGKADESADDTSGEPTEGEGEDIGSATVDG